MQEMVGKVSLDYTYYPGKDLYSDGEIEKLLLEIASETQEDDLERVIAEKKDWSVLYHMSDVRENIVASMPIRKEDHVLEIGAGCGAITGQLARMAASVTCVDLSRQRSLINANRHKEYDNIRILVGNFQDIEKNLTETFDVITLIGVFEYAQGYIGTDAPYAEFLRQIRRHLKPGGRIVIAIENRLGLKYWAGCREDHTGNFFEGLENYPQGAHVRTFTRPELEAIFDEVGLKNRTFYYPYPDYKLPGAIYSDDYLPARGSLNRNLHNFDRDRLLLFDETAVFDSLVAGGVFSLFSNSYLVLLSEDTVLSEDDPLTENGSDAPTKEDKPQREKLQYTKFSGERAPRFAIRTDIMETESGRVVVKRAAKKQAREHIQHMVTSAGLLEKLYRGSRIHVNAILSHSDEDVTFAYLAGGHTLESLLHELIKNDQGSKADALVKELADCVANLASEDFVMTPDFAEVFRLSGEERKQAEKLLAHAKCTSVTNLDMVAENLMLRDDGDWDLIDYEWTYHFPIPARFTVYRIWHYYAARCMQGADERQLLLRAGFDAEEIRLFERMEKGWQDYVQGDRKTLPDLYACISPGTVDVKAELALRENRRDQSYAGWLYYTETDDFSEKQKYGCVTYVDENGHFSAELSLRDVPPGARLRWDPLEQRMCKMQIETIRADVPVTLQPINGVRNGEEDAFFTPDPAYELIVDTVQAGSIRIEGTLEIIYRTEAERLQAQIDAIYSTKAYRLLEKARRIRDFWKPSRRK